jgi:NAD(P)H-dependent flavin oxidoreductase YrpB (nitropropane dioxygenase family)
MRGAYAPRCYNGAVIGHASGDLRDVLGIERPIVQAPVGVCATPRLVAAVAAAGGIGTLACTWTEPERLAGIVAGVRELTQGPFAANLVLWFDVDAQLDALLAALVPVVTFSWGQPGRARIERCRAAGARVLVQVGSAAGASQAVRDGADAVIAQGVEAGGHVQSSTRLAELLDDVLAAAEGVPVIAAGGLALRADVERALASGAACAMLGTSFLATAESGAHDDYKAALVTAAPGATVLTVCFDGDWPQAPHRVLRNRTLELWEAAGCPASGRRPGEDEPPAMRGARAIARYHDAPPFAGDEGEIGDMCLYAGEGCGAIEDIPTVAQLVDRLAPR